MFEGPLPESRGQNLALTVLYVPYSLNSGGGHVEEKEQELQHAQKSTPPQICQLILYYYEDKE